MINLFLWLVSHWPFICFSDDNNFATLKRQNIKNKSIHLRFSLINIMIGATILYILTFDFTTKKPALYKMLRLEDMRNFILTDTDMSQKEEKYVEHIKSLNPEDLLAEKEKLCYLIQNEEARLNKAFDKINAYASILLGVLALIVALSGSNKFIFYPPTSPLFYLCIFLSFSFLNICAFIFQGIMVKGISKSTFSDLKNSSDKSNTLIVQYYYDWQQLKYKADLFVSYVLNLQHNVLYAAILMILVIIIRNFL